MLFFLWSFVYSFWWFICSGYAASIQNSRNLRPVLAIQELFAFESVDVFECLEDEFDKSPRFQNPTTANEIEKRERDGIAKKTRVVGKGLPSLGWIAKHTNWNPWRWVQVLFSWFGRHPRGRGRLLAYKIHIGSRERWWQVVPGELLVCKYALFSP